RGRLGVVHRVGFHLQHHRGDRLVGRLRPTDRARYRFTADDELERANPDAIPVLKLNFFPLNHAVVDKRTVHALEVTEVQAAILEQQDPVPPADFLAFRPQPALLVPTDQQLSTPYRDFFARVPTVRHYQTPLHR